MGVAIGLAVSFMIFATMRSFAKPAPHTMTKEWQEQTNEYLKVRPISPIADMLSISLTYHRHCSRKTRSLLLVFRPRVTLERDRSSLLLHRSTKVGWDALLEYFLRLKTKPCFLFSSPWPFAHVQKA